MFEVEQGSALATVLVPLYRFLERLSVRIIEPGLTLDDLIDEVWEKWIRNAPFKFH